MDERKVASTHMRKVASKANHLYCGWVIFGQYMTQTHLALLPASFDAPCPRPPVRNVEAFWWTPWCAVNILPVNSEFGGAGGTYARSSSSKLYMQLCRFYISTGKISSIHRLDGLPSNMQSAYYNCATCMLGVYNAACVF